MRWAITIGVVLTLASCGPDSAIEIVAGIPDASAIDEVKLYVGLGGAQNESGSAELLVPPGYDRTTPPRGFYWKRDDARPGGDRASVEPGAREVRFVFQPGTHDKLTVIVVGYRAGAAVAAALLEDAVMESGTVRQYVVELAPLAPPRSLQEWGPEPDDRVCAHYRDAEHSIYVVTKDDRDCDGFPDDDARECRPDVYRGYRRPKRESLACLTDETLPPLSPTGAETIACVLGGPGCVDGRGSGECDAGTVCMASPICEGCAEHASPLDCAAAFASSGSTIAIACKFHATREGGALAFCPGAATLSGRIPPGVGCDPTGELGFWLEGSGTWTATALTKGSMTFTATKPTADCGFALAASGTPITTELRAVVTAQLANQRGVALPLAIDIEETQLCDNTPNLCVVTAAPVDIESPLGRCIRTAITEPW